MADSEVVLDRLLARSDPHVRDIYCRLVEGLKVGRDFKAEPKSSSIHLCR